MKWSFEQIEGSDRKRIELDGWSAPFGRPRRDPVIKELLKSRIQTTYYPGSSKSKRHAFGTNYEATELRGRWMTKVLLADKGKTANEVANDWTEFFKDERTCRISWGFIVSYVGYIDELEIGRESEDEIAWRMKIQIDNRDDDAKSNQGVAVKPRSAADNVAEFNKIWASFGIKQIEIPDNLNPDFLESLDNLAKALNEPAAELNKLVGRIDDIEKGTFSTIQHFRSAISGFGQALVEMHNVVVNTEIDAALTVRSSEFDLQWIKYQLDFDVSSMLMRDVLAGLDRSAELAGRQEVSKFVQAKAGDTWESISIRATGSPDKAKSIRSLNGAKYGQRPIVGESYLVQ